MSLSAIVQALGGELYERGRRAVVPGPGHSRHDRSVSLLLSEGRLIVHSFGRSSWREVLDELRGRGLVDASGRPAPGGGDAGPRALPRSGALRTAAAAALWTQGAPLARQLSLRHVRRRGVTRSTPISPALRHHGGVAQAAYAGRGPRRPALLAAVVGADGDLSAVEVTYLDPDGSRARGLAPSRKVIGVLPPACAVRLDAIGPELLVGEGVFTTLSASAHFDLPGWALLSTRNLRSWSPPPEVRRVLIAADRGTDGERSALILQRRLLHLGVAARVAWPAAPFGDWNEAVRPAGVRGREGWSGVR